MLNVMLKNKNFTQFIKPGAWWAMWSHNNYKYFASTLAVTVLIQCVVHLIECIKTVLLDGDHIYTQYPGICSII